MIMMRLRGCVETLLRSCPPSSYPIVPLCRIIVRLATSRPFDQLQDFYVVIKYLNDAQTGAKAIYSPYHPTLAILAAQMAKCLAIDLVPEDRVPHLQLRLGRGFGGHEMMVLQGIGVIGERSRLEKAVQEYRDAIHRCEGCFGSEGGLLATRLRGELAALERELASA